MFTEHRVVPAADTVNSRCWSGCLWNWHTKGDCLRAADEVNWRAARATEKRAAMLYVFNCVGVGVERNVLESVSCRVGDWSHGASSDGYDAAVLVSTDRSLARIGEILAPRSGI